MSSGGDSSSSSRSGSSSVATSLAAGPPPLEVANAEDVEDFPHQVAGHFAQPIRRYKGVYLLKPRLDEDRFDRELAFYKKSRMEDSELRSIADFLPQYYGQVAVGSDRVPHIVLEDLTAPFSSCVHAMDLKLGKITYDPNSSREKAERVAAKYPYQAEIGFRIAGMKTFDVKRAAYCRFNKQLGGSFKPGDIGDALGCYFYNGTGFDTLAVAEMTQQLKVLLQWFEQQSLLRFYSCSLLLLYEPCSSCAGGVVDSAATSPSPLQVKVALIDFAHTVEAVPSDPCALDDNYIFGLSRLVSALESLETQMEVHSAELIERVEAHLINFEPASP
jgi:inositol-polyphosphate multikinase